jgi:hypothetical protein
MSNNPRRVVPGNPRVEDTPQLTSRVLADLKVLRTGTLSQRMFSAFDYKHDEWAPLRPWVLHPHSTFATTWQIGTTLFILLSTLYIPFELAFDYVTSFETTPAAAVFHVLNPFVDVYFLIDMVLQFRLAYQEDGDLVQDNKMMALHYLRGWFAVDSVSSMAAVTVWMTDVTGYRALRNVRFIRIFRLLKLLRVAKLKQLLVLLDGVRTELVVVSKLLKLALVTVCCAHLLACGFYMTGKQGGPDAKYEFDGSWLDAYYEKFLGMEDGKWLATGHKDYQTIEQKYMVALCKYSILLLLLAATALARLPRTYISRAGVRNPRGPRRSAVQYLTRAASKSRALPWSACGLNSSDTLPPAAASAAPFFAQTGPSSRPQQSATATSRRSRRMSGHL